MMSTPVKSAEPSERSREAPEHARAHAPKPVAAQGLKRFAGVQRHAGNLAVQRLLRSGYLTDLACEALENSLRPGLTEQDVLSIVYNAYIKNGGDPGIHFIATTNMDNPDRFVP